MSSNLRTSSGRQLRSPGLHETPLPLTLDASIMPGARVLGEDGQIYESMKDLVSGLYEWQVRAQGERGPALELQKSATHIQWRVEGSQGPWTDLVPLSDILGPPGPEGPQGAGLSFQGTVATVEELPTPSTLGYGYLVTATNDIWVYNGEAWVNAGPIRGPQGAPGSEGPQGEQGPAGEDGVPVQLRKTETELQWRLVGDVEWQTLTPLNDIKGPAGDVGPDGPPGPGFNYRGSIATIGELPESSTQGYAYLVNATGDLYIYNGSAWVNAGPLQGPPGADGSDGVQGDPGPEGPPGPGFSYRGSVATVANLPAPSTEGYAFLVEADGNLYIYNGEAWVNAGPLQGPPGADGADGSPGVDGKQIELQASETHLQWRYVGDTEWLDILLISTIQGPKGDKGDKGDQGEPGTDGFDGRTILSGTVDPTTQGANGDFYINTTSSKLFGPKTGGTWPAGISLIGPTGDGVAAGGNTGQVLVKSTNENYQTTWATALMPADIGSTVQGYDAETAKLDAIQTWTAAQTFTGGLTVSAPFVLEGTTADDFEVTIACEPTADRTITLPNATTTLAGLSVAQTFTAVQTLTDPAIIGTILEDVYTIVDGAAFEVDPGNGSIQLVTLGASRTPKATNFAAGESVTLMVADGTAYTITWTDATWGGSGVVWVGGSAPTLATSGYTVIQLWKVSTQVYGAKVGDVA